MVAVQKGELVNRPEQGSHKGTGENGRGQRSEHYPGHVDKGSDLLRTVQRIVVTVDEDVMADPGTIILLRERLLAAGWNPVDVLLMEHVAIVAMSAAAALLMLYVPDLMDWWPWRRSA